MQYGAIGMVIGHELTHGFDSSGRQYDKHGNLRDWWSASADANFKEKAKCLVDQYSQYTFFGHKAYQNWIAKHESEKILPGLKLSPEQLFFVGFAQQWCSSYTPKGVEMRKYDTHTTQKYRVIGTLSNFNKFSEAFQCPVDSPMNPTKKCSVW
ncbi:Endothelin-converting enzyme 1 [Exaiptasia diaphana]|nr:Endothelin-converting enzyme 1 [Exaiptasia diaphana]